MRIVSPSALFPRHFKFPFISGGFLSFKGLYYYFGITVGIVDALQLQASQDTASEMVCPSRLKLGSV